MADLRTYMPNQDIPTVPEWWDGAEGYLSPIQQLIVRFQPKNGLEVGFGYWGFSSRLFLSNCEGKLTTIDKGDWKGEAENLSKACKRFKFVKGRSELELPKLKQEYDYCYIDGDHSYDGAKRDAELAIKLIKKGGIIAFDDCDVPFISALDVDDETGAVIDGMFGVGQAVKDVMDNNKDFAEIEVYPSLANGGRVFRRIR